MGKPDARPLSALSMHKTIVNKITAEHQRNTSQCADISRTRQHYSIDRRIKIVFNNLSHNILVMIFTIFVLLPQFQSATSNPIFTDNLSLEQFQSGRNIRHLPCIVRKSGRSGVCMFAIDCIKRNGTHLGTCIDRFYFGSCCDINIDTPLYSADVVDNSIDQNTISHHFSFETTTMPTSALIQSTTSRVQPPLSNNYNNSILIVGPQKNRTEVTKPEISSNSSHLTGVVKPIKLSLNSTTNTATRRPILQTTHKNSHFVVRTTSRQPPTKKPTKTTTSKITVTPNIKKNVTSNINFSSKPTTVRATIPPKLTQSDSNLGTTTQPSKLFTFQTVETTIMPITESVNLTDWSVAGIEKLESTEKSNVISSTSKPIFLTNTQRISTKPKPQTTRTTTSPKTPPQTKRPAVKPTRKPSPTTINTNGSHTYLTTTTELSNQIKDSVITTETSKPKPKPTADFIKSPKPVLTSVSPIQNTTQSSLNVSSSQLTTESSGIDSTKTSPNMITSTSHPAEQITISTAKQPSPMNTTAGPNLVTWTNDKEEPHNQSENATQEGTGWQQKPSDWVPVPTIATQINATDSNDNKTNTFVAPIIDSDEIKDVLVTSSVSAVINHIKPVVSTSESALTLQTTSSTTTTPEPTFATPASESSATTEIVNATSTTLDVLIFDQVTTEYELSNTTYPTTSSPVSSLEGLDYRRVCGRRMFPEPRIVGGSNAAFGRWPWQISLRQWRTSTYLHKCGAALLNENWAITAAHCVDNVPPSDLLLRLGEYDLAEEEEPYGYQERRVQIVASHPQFDSRTFEYDLALLRFYEPVVFQPNIIPVCVPDSDENFIGQTAFVTGWGRLYEDGPLPSVLQEVAVPVINNTICESMYRAAGHIEHIPHIFICAGWKKGGYDSCEGDSGGPMVLQRESDKRFQLGGVISWGIGCAEANQPGVYTRISEFRDWINQILQF
uniref:Peptidase S1 domain-containing protein n=1 Tax=Glossina brevipalpis TaxID=37001 RepID=A0A1A9W2F1_9MUSC